MAAGGVNPGKINWQKIVMKQRKLILMQLRQAKYSAACRNQLMIRQNQGLHMNLAARAASTQAQSMIHKPLSLSQADHGVNVTPMLQHPPKPPQSHRHWHWHVDDRQDFIARNRVDCGAGKTKGVGDEFSMQRKRCIDYFAASRSDAVYAKTESDIEESESSDLDLTLKL